MVEKKQNIIEILKQFSQAVSQKYELSKLVLYGSYSKGKATGLSDIDVAVFLKNNKNDSRVAINCQLYKIALAIDSRIEPRCFFEEEVAIAEPASILFDIIKTGTLITSL